MVQIKHRSNVLEWSTVSNGDLLAGPAIPGPTVVHSCHNIHVFHLAEDHMLAIQPLSLGITDENPETICVRSSICHGQAARTCVLQDEILIIEFLPTDGDALAISATVVCEVTTLAHTSQNNSVKAETFITTSFLPSAQSTKVFCWLWNFACKQLKGDVAQGLTVGRDVEEHGGVDHG